MEIAPGVLHAFGVEYASALFYEEFFFMFANSTVRHKGV